MRKNLLLFCSCLMLLLPFASQAEEREQDFKYHFAVSSDVKLMDNLKLNIEPEFRFDKEFGIDKSLINAGLAYSPFSKFSFGAAYRLLLTHQDGGGVEVSHRMAYEVNYKDSFGNFVPSVRVRYNNFTEDVASDGYLRYRGKLDYKLSAISLTPYVSVEFFQQCNDNGLTQMRYSTGGYYALNKQMGIVFDYEIDYFRTKPTTSHTFTVAYKLKF